MIKSIELKDYKIFKDTKFDNCKKYNLIFGYNGTGKSTLTKLFKEFEYNTTQLNNEKYNIEMEEGTPLNIKVYHGSNYIEDNIINENENFIFFTIGKDFKELKNKQENILSKIEVSQKELKDIKSLDIDKEYSQVAKKIVEKLQLTTQSFNKNHVKIEYDRNLSFNRIEENKYNEILSKSNSTETKDIIQNLNIHENKFELLKNDLSNLLLKQIEKPIEISNEFQKIIDRYNADKDLQVWIQKGLKYKIYIDEKECPFCGRDLDIKILETKNLFQEFENYFNNKELKIKEELEVIRNKASMYFNEIKKNEINPVLFFQEEQIEIDILKKNIEEKYKILDGIYKSYINLIEEKINITYDIINKDIPDFLNCIDELNKNINEINIIINKHNERVNNSKKEKDNAIEIIKHHILAENQENIIKMKKEIEQLGIEKTRLTEDIKIKNKELELIEQEIKNTKIPIDEFNKNLKHFIGRDNIKLEYDDQKQSYKLKRDNEDTEKSLSEGEKTIIALVHFIWTLKHKKEKNSRSRNNEVNIDDENIDLSNCVVVIDDPISSLDSNFVYNAYAYLQTQLEGCGQIFILTHHFYFFKRVQKWFEHTDKKKSMTKQDNNNYRIKEIVRTGNSSTIENINDFFRLYETEYQYIYNKVIKLKEKCVQQKTLTEDEKISLPNECRKIFESAVSFLYPFEDKGRGTMFDKRTKDIINNITSNLDDEYKNKYIECLNYIYRYSNTESHLQSFDYINLHLKNDKESYDLIKFIIKFIEEYIPNHLDNYTKKILQNDNDKQT